MSEGQVDEPFDGTNDIWRQTGTVFETESIMSEPARNENSLLHMQTVLTKGANRWKLVAATQPSMNLFKNG
jgi:hypothetical protein